MDTASVGQVGWVVQHNCDTLDEQQTSAGSMHW